MHADEEGHRTLILGFPTHHFPPSQTGFGDKHQRLCDGGRGVDTSIPSRDHWIVFQHLSPGIPTVQSNDPVLLLPLNHRTPHTDNTKK